MNNTIINVTVLETLNDKELETRITKALASAETAAFKVATLCAWWTGEKVGTLTIASARKRKLSDVVKVVGKSKATISRWLKAWRYISENNLFDDFNSGKYPFSFDKIILIFGNEDIFDGMEFETLMDMSVSALDGMVHPVAEESADTEESASAEESAETTEESVSGEMVTLDYAGQTYSVDKALLEDFLSNHATLA